MELQELLENISEKKNYNLDQIINLEELCEFEITKAKDSIILTEKKYQINKEESIKGLKILENLYDNELINIKKNQEKLDNQYNDNKFKSEMEIQRLLDQHINRVNDINNELKNFKNILDNENINDIIKNIIEKEIELINLRFNTETESAKIESNRLKEIHMEEKMNYNDQINKNKDLFDLKKIIYSNEIKRINYIYNESMNDAINDLRRLNNIQTMEKIIRINNQNRLQEIHEEDVKHQTEMHSLIRIICHEIRNPLQGIISNTEYILLSHLEDDNIKQSLDDIVLCALYQSEILNDLINFESMNLKTYNSDENLVDNISIDNLIEEVISIYRDICNNKGVQLIINNKINLVGSFHRKSIKTILMNLIGNATKFTEKGIININISINFEVDTQRTMIQISVKDTGFGIEPNIKNKIFKSYGIKSKNIKDNVGSGLGLKICALIIDSIKGHIKVISELNIGSEFIFSFPIIKVQLKDSINNIEPIEKTIETIKTIETKKILIVEDNKVIRKIYEKMFKNIHNSDLVSNGEEAIIKYEESIISNSLYDLILMDYNMPNMCGYECISNIRKNNNKIIPVIFITGEISSDVQIQILSLSKAYLLLKPIRRIDLLNFISKLDYS